MRTLCKATRTRGISLGEVLIAISVLTIATLAILGALISSMDLNFKDRELTMATNFAQREIEKIHYSAETAANFDSLASTSYTSIAEYPKMISATRVETIQTSIKKVTVNIYYVDESVSLLQPNTSKPNQGKIIQLSCYLIRP